MKIKQFFNKYFDAIETILILGFAAGMILILQEVKEFSYWTIRISLGGLAVLYWSKTVQRKENQTTKEKISEKIIWYAFMLAPIAILSKLQFQENANIFLIFSIIITISAIIYRIIERTFKQIKTSEIIRALIIFIISLWLYSLPLTPLN